MRTRTDIAAAYRSRVLFGAHVSSSGGIHKTLDRAEAMGADCVQLFTQSPRMWRPTNHDPANFAAFKERRAELGIPTGGVIAHALYLCNLAAPDDEIYGKSRAALRNTMEVARKIEADGVVFHVGSHLGAGMDVGMQRCVPALREALELSTHTTWLLVENNAGAGGTIGRSLDELDEQIGLERLRALHINDSATPLGSNRDRHANIGEGELGEQLGVFLSHPKLQGLPAFLEVPGEDKRGPNADELRKVRELHERWAGTAG